MVQHEAGDHTQVSVARRTPIGGPFPASGIPVAAARDLREMVVIDVSWIVDRADTGRLSIHRTPVSWPSWKLNVSYCTVYVCIGLCLCTCVGIRFCVHKSVCVCTHRLVCVYVCMQGLCVRVCVCTHRLVCAYMCTCECVHVYV